MIAGHFTFFPVLCREQALGLVLWEVGGKFSQARNEAQWKVDGDGYSERI